MNTQWLAILTAANGLYLGCNNFKNESLLFTSRPCFREYRR